MPASMGTRAPGRHTGVGHFISLCLFRSRRPQDAHKPQACVAIRRSLQVFRKKNSMCDLKGPLSHLPKASQAPPVFIVAVDTCKIKYQDFCSLFLNKTGQKKMKCLLE